MARFRDLPDAEVASATLEAAGIENSLADVCTIGVAWTYSTALGWIRLSVGDSDGDAAREVLKSAESVEWPVEFARCDAADLCPVCDSADLEIVSGSRKTLALMLLTMFIPLWFWRSKLLCRACGSSRIVPLHIRPDLVGVWLIAAVGAYVLMALVFLIVGYTIHGRS